MNQPINTFMRVLVIVLCCALTVLFVEGCGDKKETPVKPVIVGREGDTCRLARTTLDFGYYLTYEYVNKRVKKIILNADGGDYPCEPVYDAAGRLQRVSGKIVDTAYEYDTKGRVVKETRILHRDSVNTHIPHYSQRLFEYDEADHIIKCSYVEGLGTDYNPIFVKKGEVYRIENYSYDVQDDLITMVVSTREPKDTKFRVTEEYAYFYDKLINPFYGHPGLFDFNLYVGTEVCNAPVVLSKHNIIRRVIKGVPTTTSYIYTDTKYPLSSPNIAWLDSNSVGINLEYQNCK